MLASPGWFRREPWSVAVAASTPFVRRQSRLAFPLLDFAIFRNAAFTSGVMAAAFAMFAIGGIQLVTTQRFQLVAGFCRSRRAFSSRRPPGSAAQPRCWAGRSCTGSGFAS